MLPLHSPASRRALGAAAGRPRCSATSASRITRAHAIDVLLAHLGADRADTIAFGDARVDIPMLEYCACGVAMGNGGPEIRAMADLVTDDVEHDGLWHAFRKLGLLGAE